MRRKNTFSNTKTYYTSNQPTNLALCGATNQPQVSLHKQPTNLTARLPIGWLLTTLHYISVHIASKLCYGSQNA
jgi:hypothetical protein